MSATNRGSQRNEGDFYPTPGWCVDRLLDTLPLPGGTWLEPAAGTGAIIRAVNARRADVDWRAVELNDKFKQPLQTVVRWRAVRIASFLDVRPSAIRVPISVLITNPPFNQAMSMIDHAMKFSAQYCVMLLRLNFLASSGRAEFMRRHAPDVYVLPDRPSFSGRGTDSIEYAWFVWHGSRVRTRGKLTVLAPTSAEARGVARRAPRRA